MGLQSRGCSLLYSLNKHLASVCWVQDPNPWWHGAETLVQGRREEDTDKSRRESEAAMDKTLRPGPVLSVGPGPLPRTAWENVSPCLGWAMCLAGRLSRPSPAPCPLEESREALGPEVWEGSRQWVPDRLTKEEFPVQAEMRRYMEASSMFLGPAGALLACSCSVVCPHHTPAIAHGWRVVGLARRVCSLTGEARLQSTRCARCRPWGEGRDWPPLTAHPRSIPLIPELGAHQGEATAAEFWRTLVSWTWG